MKWNWSSLNEDELREVYACVDKGQMYKAPANILGTYCCKDTDSTWQFWKLVLEPLFKRFSTYEWYHHEPFMSCVTQHVRQQFTGMQLDKKRLETAHKIITYRQNEAHKKFFTHERVAPAIAEWNRDVVNEYLAKEPSQFKINKFGEEPARFKANGQESMVWRRWYEKSQAEPVVSKNWLKWKEGLEHIKTTQHFNLNSSDQCRWLFYKKLGFEPIIFTKGKDPKPATGKDAIVGFGEVGQLLKEYKDEVKMLSFVDKYLERLDHKEVLRVTMRIPGTLSGRLSGSGGLNVQQISNDYEILNAFKAREGSKLIISDFAALEPVCLAETSGDPALLNVYGKDAPPGQDLYLYNGAQTEGIKEHFLSLGYAPLNPTKESIKACKEKAKKWRNVAKCITLASSYGAGPGKIRQTLALQGVELPLAAVKLMHQSYWKLYAGTKKYEKYLINQWEKNGGWVFNGIGRPICLDSTLIKDIINRVTQAVGHDNLLIYLWILRKHLEKENIPYAPFIWDLHDAVFLDVPDAYVERVCELINTIALDEFNAFLNPRYVKLKLVANVVNTFAEDKIEKLEEAQEDWAIMEALVNEEED